MKKLSFIFSCFCICNLGNLFAQGLYLVNSSISIKDNAEMTIQGNLSSESNSQITNEGSIRLRDNLINNGSNVLFINENAGDVTLYGNNQSVTGSDSTVFYNLYFDGNNFDVKDFQLGSTILNELNINNQILQTFGNRVYLLNSNSNALQNGLGYISSSDLGGYFVRSTNSTDSYLFPVGSENLGNTHRPVVITPLSNLSNLYEVRLSPIGPQVDNTGTSASGAVGPFDVSQKVNSLGPLNQNYYHNINQLSGNSNADIDVFFNSNDGNFQTLAQWLDTQFENPNDELFSNVLLGCDQYVSLKNFNNYNDDVFVLAQDDTTSTPCPEFYVPSVFSPNNDLNNDQYCVYWGCYDDIHLTILNRWGEIVFETEDPLECWSGNQNSKDLNTGVFVYMINVTDPSTGETIQYSGNITLIK